jgi:hypothetical protein
MEKIERNNRVVALKRQGMSVPASISASPITSSRNSRNDTIDRQARRFIWIRA